MLKPHPMSRCALIALLALLTGGCFLEGPPPPRSEYSIENPPLTPVAVSSSSRDGARGIPGVSAVPAAARKGAAGDVPSDTGGPIVLQHDTGGPYIFNAKFEPPRGRIIHGMGNWLPGNAAYLRMLDDPDIMPAGDLVYVIMGDWPRPWDRVRDRLGKMLEADKAAGRFPDLNLSLTGLDPATQGERGIDHEIANSDRYDEHIRDMAKVVAALQYPVFVRIGGEFSGEWNDYHVYDYPKAYRKIVDIFRQEGVTNAAYVWCYEPSAPDDFDVHDEGGWRWFPGDDVIDWYGLDIFQVSEFIPQSGRRVPVRRWELAERFLNMARDHGKPVVVAESSASEVAITPDLMDGRRDWDTWFAPYFAFLDRHPEIEAFHYVNTDWTKNGKYAESGWLDARLEINSYVSRKWIEEMHKPRYLHANQVSLLNGFAEACAARPQEPAGGQPTGAEDPRRAAAGR